MLLWLALVQNPKFTPAVISKRHETANTVIGYNREGGSMIYSMYTFYLYFYAFIQYIQTIR